MHGSKAPGDNKPPPALPRLPVGPNLKISEVHMGHPTNMIPIFPKLFTVIVNFTTQMKCTACSSLVKYRRQAGLKSTNWRAGTSLPLNFMSYAGKVGTTLLFAHSPKDDMLAYFSLAPSRKPHSCRFSCKSSGKAKLTWTNLLRCIAVNKVSQLIHP